MNRNWTAMALVLLSALPPAFAASDILIADFEGTDYGDWRVEGEAFGPGPAKGTLPDQMPVSGFHGKRLVNTYFNGDEAKGTLTSPQFTIQRPYINFLIGGGKHPGRTCMDLLVDDKVVRTATGPNDRPGGSEKLSWQHWDVGEFQGKKAIIRIVDDATGGWGHINVDHIAQSDHIITPVDAVSKIQVTKRYLHFPVKNGAPKHYIDIIVDGKIVRQFDIELAPKGLAEQQPDFWVFLDMSPFKGKTATIKMHDSDASEQNPLDVITLDDRIKDADTIYKEKHRPQFHFTSRRGWNNDSNGMVYYKGEYHLFYQHNPYGWNWGNMTWGHAISKDMVHWKELPDAIHPDELGTIFSGSAAVDEHNTAGFQTGKENPIICFYTSAGGLNLMSKGQPFTQSIAYSNDRGRTWNRYNGNPVLGHVKGSNRDPKVIWYEPTSEWVMVLYLDQREMGFYSSKNLTDWRFHSKLRCFHECPELFELAVDGNENDKRWVLYGASGDYYVGDFNGRIFTPQTKATQFSFGNCFYASQTFNNIPKKDGRRLQIAWGQSATPGMPFNQCMLFPCTLTLRTTEDGIRLFAYPVREIESIHGKKHTWRNRTVRPGDNLLEGIRGDLFDIIADVDAGEDVSQWGFDIRGVKVTCDMKQRQLACRDKTAPITGGARNIRLRILVDRTTVEIFLNDGRIYMPIAAIPDDNNKDLGLYTEGGPLGINNMEVYELNPVW